MPRPRKDKPEYKLIRRGKSEIWYVSCTIAGRTERFTTGKSDEREAREFLADFIARKKVTVENRVDALLDHYLEHKAEHYRVQNAPPRNYTVLETALKPVRRLFGDYRGSDINRQSSREFAVWRRSQGIKDATIRKQLSIFQAALNFCRNEGLLQCDPVAFEMPPAPPPRQHYMTPEQVRQFMEAPAYPHIDLFCLLALHTLSRKSAILGLEWSWGIDFDRGLINFNPPERIHTKKRRVTVPMGPTLREALMEAWDFALSDYVVEFRGKPLVEISNGFASKAEAAGLDWVTPHVLRHTGASLLAQRGTSMLEIAQIMGDDVRTVEKHYLKFSPDYLKGATTALEEIYG